MDWKVKVVIAGVAVLTVIAVLDRTLGRSESAPSTPSEASQPNPSAVAAIHPTSEQLQEVVRLGLKMRESWQDISVDVDDARSYRLWLTYRKPPKSHGEVERDSTEIARVALSGLVQAGRNPAAERMAISVWARSHESGETGKPLTRLYGRTRYDFNSDSLVYKPAD
ncbi:hypothetical protein [Lysobacter sp. Root96]|uniref:hypothetical protein n=1 Tax=Lysobacter sp. Root96 TaxID=1736612 RepID=UPI0012F9F09D|nr:hypothetical protein [Lysobacter sp. Root96]